MLTFGKTCCGTGCCYCSIYNLGVTESINYCLCYCYCAAYGTMLTFGKTCCSTGCCYRSIYNLGVTESCDLFCVAVATERTCIGFITCCSTCCGYGSCNCVIMTTCCSCPYTVSILISICDIGNKVCSVAVLKNCISDSNFMIYSLLVGCIVCLLICHGLAAGVEHYRSSSGTVYVCTTCSSIYVTLGSINRTIYNNLCINEISRCTCIGLGICIADRSDLEIRGRCITAPFSGIVNIHVYVLAYYTACILTNNHPGAGKECCILVYCDVTALGIDGHVRGDRKLIICSLNGCGA